MLKINTSIFCIEVGFSVERIAIAVDCCLRKINFREIAQVKNNLAFQASYILVVPANYLSLFISKQKKIPILQQTLRGFTQTLCGVMRGRMWGRSRPCCRSPSPTASRPIRRLLRPLDGGSRACPSSPGLRRRPRWSSPSYAPCCGLFSLRVPPMGASSSWVSPTSSALGMFTACCIRRESWCHSKTSTGTTLHPQRYACSSGFCAPTRLEPAPGCFSAVVCPRRVVRSVLAA